MLWRISYNSDDLQAQAAIINRTVLGAYLQMSYSYLSMSKRSVYIDKLDPGHVESRPDCARPGQVHFCLPVRQIPPMVSIAFGETAGHDG